MSWGLDHAGVQSSAGGPGGGGRDRKESAGGLRPQLTRGVGERKEEAMETQGQPESREHPRSAQAKRLGSGIWPCGPVHSDPQGGTGAQEEALCGPRETMTGLFAATHLPSQWEHVHPCVPTCPPDRHRTLLYNLGPRSRLSQKTAQASVHRWERNPWGSGDLGRREGSW